MSAKLEAIEGEPGLKAIDNANVSIEEKNFTDCDWYAAILKIAVLGVAIIVGLLLCTTLNFIWPAVFISLILVGSATTLVVCWSKWIPHSSHWKWFGRQIQPPPGYFSKQSI